MELFIHKHTVISLPLSLSLSPIAGPGVPAVLLVSLADVDCEWSLYSA